VSRLACNLLDLLTLNGRVQLVQVPVP